jgi:hypothetical protein
MNPYKDITARNWAAQNLGNPSVSFPPMIFVGDGPFDSSELARFFARFGAKVYTLQVRYDSPVSLGEEWNTALLPQSPVLVIGQNVSHELDIASLQRKDCVGTGTDPLTAAAKFWIERVPYKRGSIFRRSESLKHLAAISQEYVLAHLLHNREIGVADEAWDNHEQTHAGLCLLPKILAASEKNEPLIRWPATDADKGALDLESIDSPDKGLLKRRGYQTGKYGKSDIVRRRILAEVFAETNLGDLEEDYRREWGYSRTAGRLKKIALSLANFAKNAKRKRDDGLRRSINEWESDLAWLKREFYDGVFDGEFTWPSSNSKM